MTIEVKIKKNTYFDSVSLMSISSQANEIEHVKQVMIGMGTDMNKEVIRNVGMGTTEIDEASTGDLMIALETDKPESVDEIFAEIDNLFVRKVDSVGANEAVYKSITSAAEQNTQSNIAIISVHGMYAVREAHKALDNDLHVMLFSDNISIEDEVKLKNKAHDKGLLMMGPDCGTAIINGVGLSFANKVNRGNIGVVAASGTGAQEMSVRIHDYGYGISQLIGTGGRDLSEEVGGIMMIDGMRALEGDPSTDVIVLISKPPAKSVEEKIINIAKSIDKPVVVFFIGGSADQKDEGNIYYRSRSKDAAVQAVVLAGAKEEDLNIQPLDLKQVEEIQNKLSKDQKYIRGLFCGGTLCDEALYAAMEELDDVYSNIAVDPKHQLADNTKSQAHTFIDFGSDEFTSGKPHPMIDPSTRIERFLKEAEDPEVAVIIMDFELGYGSHPDPTGVTAPAIKEAKEKAEKEGRHLEVVGYVLGTDEDPQNRAEQVQKLKDVGVTVVDSSQDLGIFAREIVLGGKNNE